VTSTDIDTGPTSDLDAWIDSHWNPDRTLAEWWTELAEARLTVPHWPVAYFGGASDRGRVGQVMRALRRRGVPGPPAGLGLMLAGPTLLEHGDTAQCDRYLSDIVHGRTNWCQLFSEPDAGSDLANVRTRATRDGDGWVVHGQKLWTSNGHLADFGMLLARTDDGPRHRNLSWFVLNMDQPGIEVRPLREMTGRSLFTEVFLDGARVRSDELVGGEGNGWAVARTTLRNERQSLSAGAAVGGVPGRRGGMLERRAGDLVRQTARATSGTSIAMRHRAYDTLVELARKRARLADPQVRDELAALYILERAAEELPRARPLSLGGAKGQTEHRGSVGKLLGSRITARARDIGMSLLGPDGMLNAGDRSLEGIVQELCLFAPAVSIYGGTDQIQKNVLAERTLGLPRETERERS
jgi:alkylation response protein AidB-like acyl-CoA dehydrogenase